MADGLKAVATFAFAALLWPVAPACAQTLSDPTRPPAGIENVAPEAPAAAVEPTNRLQTVIVGTGRRPSAIINGERVELGGRIGDQKLIKVSESEVVLAGPKGREVLRLTPDIEKNAATPAGNAQAPRRTKPAQGGKKQ